MRLVRELGDYYADIAEKLHLHFVNASVWPVELGADGVYMTAKGHQIFAEECKKVLADIFLIQSPASGGQQGRNVGQYLFKRL